MTTSLCLNCGKLKFGAFCICPWCDADPEDGEIALQFTTHYLTEDELVSIGRAAAILLEAELDGEVRFYALMLFVQMKWPKVLQMDIDALDELTSARVDALYRNLLSELPGQSTPNRVENSTVASMAWTSALRDDMRVDDVRWNERVAQHVPPGTELVKRIVRIRIACGHGAVMQRCWHRVTALIARPDYAEIAGAARYAVEEAKQYNRDIRRFASVVKNGWAGRTKLRAAYLRGVAARVEEMATLCQRLTDHMSGAAPLIPLDVVRTRQQLDEACRMYVRLVDVVLDPTRIHPRADNL